MLHVDVWDMKSHAAFACSGMSFADALEMTRPSAALLNKGNLFTLSSALASWVHDSCINGHTA
jgi:hypothetical protein